MLTQQANDILLLNHLQGEAESCTESRAKQAALAGTWLSPSPISAQGQIRTMRKLHLSPRQPQACGVTLTGFLIFLPACSPLQGTAAHARHPAEHLGEITY